VETNPPTVAVVSRRQSAPIASLLAVFIFANQGTYGRDFDSSLWYERSTPPQLSKWRSILLWCAICVIGDHIQCSVKETGCWRTRHGIEKRCPSLAPVVPSPHREEVSRSAYSRITTEDQTRAVKSDKSLPADAAGAKPLANKILDVSTEKPQMQGDQPYRSGYAPRIE
jgi:hypothetical protein